MRPSRFVRLPTAAALLALLALTGCSGTVADPISPDQARKQVVDVSRQVVTDLGAAVADATFGYDTCNDYGKPPFRGHAYLALWMPGADRSREVAPDTVVEQLRQRGWKTDPDFKSHGTTFKRDGVDVNVWVIPPPKPNDPPIAHVTVDVLGECRDTFDHRTDHTDRLFANIKGDVTPG